MDALHPVLQAFDRLFPQDTPTKDELARWAATDAADAARDDYIKMRTPEIAREYAATPAKLEDAFDRVLNAKRLPAFFTAFIAGDDLEAMRLLREATVQHLRDLAEDAAEGEGYALIPEPPL